MAKDKAKVGRPTKYNPSYCKIAKKMTELGAIDTEIAEALDVDVATFYRWRNQHPEFCESLKIGKEHIDDRVEATLLRRAVGYTQEQVKIFQYQGAELVVPYTEIVQPDTTAMIFWLKNRRPDKWRQAPEPDESSEPPPLNITFEVRQAVEQVKVTNAKS